MTRYSFRRELHHSPELPNIRMATNIQAILIAQAVANVVCDLSQGHSALACLVIADAHRLNTTQSTLQRRCLHLIERQPPGSPHTRELFMIERVGIELVHMNRRAVKVARQIVRLKYDGPATLAQTLDILAYLVCEQVEEGVRAFIERSIDRAQGLPARQEALEALCRQTSQELLECMRRDTNTIETASELRLAASELTGIGEHVINIGEQVILLASSKIVALA